MGKRRIRSAGFALALSVTACGGTTGTSGTTTTPDDLTTSRRVPIPAAPTVPASTAAIAEGAFLFADLGSYHRAISSEVEEAQAYFDQGIRLTYGFNHDEATRSFARAAVADPTCAICFWGVAYTLGPNYNIPLLPERAAAAWDALTAARESTRSASPVERALIEALATRFAGPEYVDPAAMQAYNEAYREAMRPVAAQFPEDDDVVALFADAAMVPIAWKLWSAAGDPAVGTPEIVAALEQVLARSPSHPGANHLYIHAVEASREPGRAIPSAERLPGLMPEAGHTVHMPAHIFQRVGRYADASEANRRAIAADLVYLGRTTPPGYYSIYLAHNHGFLAYSESMLGRAESSLAASRESASASPMPIVCSMPGMDFFLAEPLAVLVRFGRWDALIAEPRPAERHAAHTGLYLHAHGMALASTGRIAEAKADLAELDRLRATVPEDLITGLNSGRKVLELASKILEARIAERERRREDALRLYREAVVLEDGLAYNEPADWFYPVRHLLGAALLDARKASEAEAVYRSDLEHNPENGWALFGLGKALRAQRKNAEAEAVEARFRAAFATADVTLTRSAF